MDYAISSDWEVIKNCIVLYCTVLHCITQYFQKAFSSGSRKQWVIRKGLNKSLSGDIFLVLSKLKAFADDKLNVTQSMIFFFLSWTRKRYVKVENAGYQLLLLFPRCFQQIFAEPVCHEQNIVVTMTVRSMCERQCVRSSFRICPNHNFYNCEWISK